jgi:predicted transcriptional regulator
MLYPMKEEFTCAELAKEWCITYQQAASHIRNMIDNRMLIKTGPYNHRVYKKTIYALG